MASGGEEKERLSDRLKHAMLKPAVEGETKPGAFDHLSSVEEIEGAIKRADDTERMVGLIAAPLAAAIGLLVTGSLISNDPKAHLANGALNKAHVNPSLYLEIGGVAMLLAVLMLAFAWWRKRLYLGITMALYGLSVFNLKFWGFGVPFLLAGAWYMVRAYRLQTKLKQAQAGEGTPRPSAAGGPNRRYTPKAAPPGRSARPSSAKQSSPKQNGKPRRTG
jgi:hypothetical protein